MADWTLLSSLPVDRIRTDGSFVAIVLRSNKALCSLAIVLFGHGALRIDLVFVIVLFGQSAFDPCAL